MRSKKTSTNSRNRSGKQQQDQQQRVWPPSKGPAPAAMAELSPAPARWPQAHQSVRGAGTSLTGAAQIDAALAAALSPTAAELQVKTVIS
jgi:hypothetical protein